MSEMRPETPEEQCDRMGRFAFPNDYVGGPSSARLNEVEKHVAAWMPLVPQRNVTPKPSRRANESLHQFMGQLSDRLDQGWSRWRRYARGAWRE